MRANLIGKDKPAWSSLPNTPSGVRTRDPRMASEAPGAQKVSFLNFEAQLRGCETPVSQSVVAAVNAVSLGRRAVANFWSELADFCGLNMAPTTWSVEALPEHPFMLWDARNQRWRVRRARAGSPSP